MDFLLSAGLGDPIFVSAGANGDSGHPHMFPKFVLSSRPYTQSTLEAITNVLAEDPTAGSELLQSENCKALFISDLSERLVRVQAWLTFLAELNPQHSVYKFLPKIIRGFADTIVIPLLDSEYSECHSLPGFTDLLILTTRLSWTHRKHNDAGLGSRNLSRLLLAKISSIQHLMHSILPSNGGASLMRTILTEAQAGAKIQAIGSVKTLEGWLTAAADLCSSCVGNHGLRAELDRWNCLTQLRDSLIRLLDAECARRSKFSISSASRKIDFTQMRKLSLDDKKSGVSARSTEISTSINHPPPLAEYLSEKDLANLEMFNMKAPTGLGSLEGLLTTLRERESIFLFECIVKSFPCSLCVRRLTVPLEQRQQASSTHTRSSRGGLVDHLPRSFTDTLFGQRLGPWRVCLQEWALKDLLSVNKASQDAVRGICGKLKELASGNWDLKTLRRPLSRKMIEECHGLKEKIPLWRAAYGKRGRILWQVNVNYDEEYDMETQMISVWRIGTSDEIRKSIYGILQLQSTYTQSYIKNCSISPHDLYLSPKQYICESNNSSYPQVDITDDIQETLPGNRFYSVTDKVLDCILASPETVEFPFEISKEEIEIVKHTNSAAFILGRSGTGKTTCLLFKLLCRNIASRSYEGAVRQILLTRSSFLAASLSSYLERLMQSQLGRDFNMSGGRGDQDQSSPQGFIQEAKDPLEDHTLDTLNESNFPLVCTFDQLFTFLERAVQLADSKNSEPLSIHDRFLSTTRFGTRTSRLLDYNVFTKQYWKKNYQRRALEPDLVFAEILGIIKGSTSIERGYRPLSREEYLEMSTRRAPVFTDENSRSIVYDMYENYETQKGRFRDRDDVDRAINLLKALEKNKELKKQVQTLFDEVYVDEVQDNKLLEIDLLLTLVRNPHGIHFAGDTAQCISRDNTFRFEDIKARFYEFFFAMAQKAHKSELAKASLIKLAKNYRSHQGILSLAGNIIKLLCNGFPEQIDECAPELGNFQGAKPTFFLGFDYRILAHETPEPMSSGRVMGYFGAEQVIIVRNDAAKEQLKSVLGSTLILTIYNSKGLEFEDVVLYNFFSDSTWDSVRLRTLELLLRKDAVHLLEKEKYAGLCSELKQLYVAVTRAKKNLWIVENNRAAGGNIVALWTNTVSNSLVTLIDQDDEQAEKQARSIMKPRESRNSEAWKKQGEMLFQRSLYEDALFCFRMAKHKQGEDLTSAFILFEKASHLEGDAESISIERLEKVKKLYSKAAKLFEDALFIQKAAEAWAAAREYRNAARVLRAHGHYGKAALWYARAGDFCGAAECHTLANQHDEAVHAYRKGEHFVELIAYLRRHQEQISKSVSKRYSTLINILLQRGDLSEDLLPAAIDTLGDDNAVEEFYSKFKKTDELLAFYIERNRYHDFFKFAISKGMFESAVVEVLKKKKEGIISVDDASLDIPPQDFMVLIAGLSAMDTWNFTGFRLGTLTQTRLPATQVPSQSTRGFWASVEGLDSELRGHHCGWDEIARCIWIAGDKMKLPRQRVDEVYSSFFSKFGNDFLDLVEFLRLDTPLCMVVSQTTETDQLPIATIQKFASLAGNLLSRNIPPQYLLTSIGGLTLSHLDGKVIILSSSPLFPIVSKFEEDITLVEASTSSINPSKSFAIVKREKAYNALTEWLVPIVTRVILPTLKHLRNLLAVDRTSGPCFIELQGSCRNSEEKCKGVRQTKLRWHTKLTSNELRKHIFDLLDTAELSCVSERLYYTFGPNKTEDGAQYIKNRRAILESILKELTFLSPILNDSELQQEIWSTIISNNAMRQWPHVRDGLESLFFHRLRPEEWARRGTVSALLEERSFANRLGVMPQFDRFLWRRWRYNNIDDREASWSLRFIRGCNSMANDNVGILVENIKFIILNYISTASVAHLKSFHAILSLYEYLSLELLNRITRDDLLVPRSRRQLIRDLTNYPVISDGEKQTLQNCLINILNNLCQQFTKLATEYGKLSNERDQARQRDPGDKSSANPHSLFEVCGKRFWEGKRYMVRRGLDHLALCIVNLDAGRKDTMLSGSYNILLGNIKSVCQAWAFLSPPTKIVWRDTITTEELARQLCEVYGTYNKDELVIVGRASDARSRFDFLAAGRRITRVTTGRYQNAIITSKPESNQEHESGKEAAAASKLAAWWRRCSKRLAAQKEHDKRRAKLLGMGLEGRAQVAVTRLTQSMINCRSRQQRYIIENEGIMLLGGVLWLLQFIETTHRQAMDALTDTQQKYSLNTTEVETIQGFLGKLEKQKSNLQRIRDKFEEKGRVQALLETPVEKLKEGIQGASKALEKYQKDADEWAHEIEELLT